MTDIPGGWLNSHWNQLAIQLADSAAGAAYSFGMTILILTVISLLGRFIPCLRLRVKHEEEELGLDDVEIGEFAYDFVELVRDLKAPPGADGEEEESDENDGQGRDSVAAIIANGKGEDRDSYPMRALSRQELDEQPGPGPFRAPYQGPIGGRAL